jgi:hypothetical protein
MTCNPNDVILADARIHFDVQSFDKGFRIAAVPPRPE